VPKRSRKAVSSSSVGSDAGFSSSFADLSALRGRSEDTSDLINTEMNRH
jgi:hypothetical protein